MNNPEMIVVHHTGGTDANPLTDTSNQTFEIIKSWHLKLGWDDIGYHWVIEKNGKTTPGRKENTNGAHCVGYNTKSIGVCVVGNFDLTLPTKEQEQALHKLLNEITGRYPVCRDKIYPHRKFANKTCYGKLLSDSWAQEIANGKTEEMVSIPKKLAVELKKYL